jgi:hypothetical protein
MGFSLGVLGQVKSSGLNISSSYAYYLRNDACLLCIIS